MGVLTYRQRERRRSVIVAAVTLATEGGYEAVQMRDVSAKADVALGTIYHNFSSKDHLLACAMADWLGEMESRLTHRRGRGDLAADQLADVIRRAFRGLLRQPRLTEAFMRAISSTDPGVAEASVEVQARLRGIVEAPLFKFDPEIREGIISNILHICHSTMVLWMIGRIELSDVVDEIERMVRLVVMPYEKGTTARLREDHVKLVGGQAG